MLEEDSKFVPLNPDDSSFGPRALLLIGFQVDEVVKVTFIDLVYIEKGSKLIFLPKSFHLIFLSSCDVVVTDTEVLDRAGRRIPRGIRECDASGSNLRLRAMLEEQDNAMGLISGQTCSGRNGRSKVDRDSDNQQLLKLTEKDVVSSVATVLSDLCVPGEWMLMQKLHAESMNESELNCGLEIISITITLHDVSVIVLAVR
ncbi:hypothetical protein Tco_0394728 [Tanacetum coccineum]